MKTMLVFGLLLIADFAFADTILIVPENQPNNWYKFFEYGVQSYSNPLTQEIINRNAQLEYENSVKRLIKYQRQLDILMPKPTPHYSKHHLKRPIIFKNYYINPK